MEGALVLVGRYIGRCVVKDTWYSYQCIGWKVHGGCMVKDAWGAHGERYLV